MRQRNLVAPEADSLFNIGYRFRTLIDSADRSTWGEEFKFFPKGSCGAVSEMFGKHLLDNHGIDSVYASARSTSNASHAWIECHGLIICLTGDQFVDYPLPPVFVSPDQQWHARHWSGDRESSSVSKILRENKANLTWGAAYRYLATALAARRT